MTKTDFYRYCRWVHGWLSAFAFIALCFFSFTGLLLNHPEWFAAERAIEKHEFTLTEDELAQLRNNDSRAQLLVEFANERVALKGSLDAMDAEADVIGDEVFTRARGVRGESLLRADLRSGALQVTIESSPPLSILNELHRAERAGTSWRRAVDAMAIVLFALSVIGYAIFLSMRGPRLRTALTVTLASTLGFVLLFVYAVN